MVKNLNSTTENTNLQHAQATKDDEFYTQYDEVEKELNKYSKEFRGKVIYCNCDDHYGIGKGTPKSNFLKYLSDNFEAFGIKKLLQHITNKMAIQQCIF